MIHEMNEYAVDPSVFSVAARSARLRKPRPNKAHGFREFLHSENF